MMQTRALLPLLLAPVLACGGTPNSTPSDPINPDPTNTMESDPKTYVLNSVLGSIQCDGKPVANATIKIVQTGEIIEVDESGAFVVELDPKKLGTNMHRLVFSAPGFADQEHKLGIGDNDQVHLNVELERE